MESDLLRAVADRPDDDAPRLAYADWLDENGRPERAELIRLQLRANAAGAAVEPQAAARRDELLAAHGAEWLGELADHITSAVYERGFLMACKAGPIESEALRRSLLWATVQRLETADHRLAASPAMWSLREVRGLSPQGLARLCESPTPSRVESIACAPPKSESDEEEDEDDADEDDADADYEDADKGDDEDDGSLPSIQRIDGVPRLRSLSWQRPQQGMFMGPGPLTPASVAWILDSPLGDQLERLTVKYYVFDFDAGWDHPEIIEEHAQPDLGAFVDDLASRRRPPRLVLEGLDSRFVLDRVPTGRFSLRIEVFDQDGFNAGILGAALANVEPGLLERLVVAASSGKLWAKTAEAVRGQLGLAVELEG